MFDAKGFSLVEVLVSLSIFSVVSLSLFKHQIQLHKLYQLQQQQILKIQAESDLHEIAQLSPEPSPKNASLAELSKTSFVK